MHVLWTGWLDAIPSYSWMGQSGASHEMGCIHSSVFELICYFLGLHVHVIHKLA